MQKLNPILKCEVLFKLCLMNKFTSSGFLQFTSSVFHDFWPMCEHNIFSRWSNVQQLKSDWSDEEEKPHFYWLSILLHTPLSTLQSKSWSYDEFIFHLWWKHRALIYVVSFYDTFASVTLFQFQKLYLGFIWFWRCTRNSLPFMHCRWWS